MVVFVINEGEKVRRQLARMKALAETVDIIIADGGSDDGSLDEPYLRETEVTALLTKTGAGKLSAQMRMAFDFALAEGYRGVVTVDGNGKDGVEAVPEFVRLLDSGFDHVQGSRFIRGGRAVNTPPSRMLAVKLLHAPLISLASGHRQTDTTNGFRGYSARLLSDPDVAVFRDVFSTYELHYHLAIEAGRRPDMRLIETPVERVYPRGKVPTKIKGVRGNAHVLRILFKAVAGRYRYRPERKA
ncbi:glycosyltransferase family 2 protein [Microbacterium sp. ASV49]|uniref:Glycosyltransferase family 2 protein n=1 Tax=Microbacterium candidum TaxID=3041922 RepID=A0ABT7N0S3_9MICO|nr:glycosyltransferase family 2 protein [Microbacterium sp. ASV49]MDL9980305.1 glycosyltransferase family 2 protein [Microbacterium sp. ASV49]